MDFKDDIVAISSPPGIGAISLIRVSGPNAIKKTDSFLNLKKKKNLEKEKSHTLHLGEFIFKDEIIERNKFDPIVKKQKDIPYLVDQHLLEKENA